MRYGFTAITLSAFSMFLLNTSPARGEVDASTVVRYYDDGKTQVTSPTLEVGSTFNEDKMRLNVHLAQDVLTSASSEVKTYSSRGVIQDVRNEVQLNYEAQVPDGTLTLGLISSDEKDYHSKIVSAGGSREFFTKNTVIGFGLSSGQDQVLASGNANFSEAMQHQIYSISLSQILSKSSLIQLLYDFRVENGFLASPYRKAKVINGSTIIALNENHPRTRNRHAMGVKYNFYADSWKLSFATSYRLYQDSWDVLSNTIEERITRELSRKFELSGSLRYYTQKKAKFYQDYYITDPGVFYSGNNTLATYSAIALGLRPAYQLTDKMNLSMKFEYYSQFFDDATDAGQLSTLADDKKLSVSAFVIGVGLTAKF